MKISVIVAVYNVKDYIETCIKSIIGQTIKDLQIILVDDGSTDESGKICDKYKDIDNRVRVIHKKNGGLSSARNAGLNYAEGEYISFIDGDDWIEEDFFEVLYNSIITTKSDIGVVHLKKVKNYEAIKFSTKTYEKYEVFDREEAMRKLFEGNLIGYSAVNKLYKSSLFQEIRYPEGILMEDKATTYKLIHKSDKVVVNPSTKYHYYLRDNSIMRNKFNERNFISFDIHEEILRFIEVNYKDLENIVRARYVHAAVRTIIMMMKSQYNNKDAYVRCSDIVYKNIKICLREKKVNIKIKLLAFVVYCFPRLPYMVFNKKIIQNILKYIEIS
ncbi:glycosyltransferase family 2 protein [Clostridium paraputrificum]|uniref:glycosyltransferase family 2 protein n=1 Tax=Clostridium paraputrificum TaxID=29363 RepID=UPI00232E22C8|nr:glycosyltransferase family 2 protein [Clostridium paraputrificum]MDB2106219.1 glycosyltransferase family 2 protein [Clostridium paraputrificum]MDB2112910.1 glycosyltransferase family 2 protein [Clostridium paraputrificum]